MQGRVFTVLVRAYFPKADGPEQTPKFESALQEIRDPGWMMLAPLVIFAAAIIGLGLYSGPVMEIFTEIGRMAG